MKTIVPLALLLTLVTTVASGFSLDTILADIQAMPDVRIAALRAEEAALAVERSTRATLPTLSIVPTARVTGGPALTDLTRGGLAGSATLAIPLGLTAEQISRIEMQSATAAERGLELESVHRDTILDVTRLYHTTWLQQELITVRMAERDAASMQYDADRLRFERGEISLTTLIRSELALAEAETAVRQTIAERTVHVNRLALATGLSLEPDEAQTPPPVLLSDSDDHAVDLRTIDLNVMRRSAEFEALAVAPTPHAPMLEFSRLATGVTHTAGYGELGASVSITPNTRSASVSYQSPELLLFGEAPQTQERWNASVSVSFSIDPNTNRDLAEADARLRREESALQLQAAENRVIEAELRASHDVAAAREARAAALETLERSRQTRDLVSVQVATGRATVIDEQTADAAILRSEYLVERARLEYEAALMRAHPERAAQALEEWLLNTMENQS